MKYIFDSNTPIYIQVSHDIKRKIIKGIYKPNDKIESVRELAENYGVNPNTIQKSMQDLENEGLLYSVRASGRYISESEILIQRCQKSLVNKYISDFILNLESLGLSIDDAIQLLQNEKGEKHDG